MATDVSLSVRKNNNFRKKYNNIEPSIKKLNTFWINLISIYLYGPLTNAINFKIALSYKAEINIKFPGLHSLLS